MINVSDYRPERAPAYQRYDGTRWQKMKEKEKLKVENMLRDMENDCVGVCGRFLNMRPSRDHLWMLNNQKKELKAVILNSGSTLMPVLCGLKEVPHLKFLKGILGIKKIHSTQGLLNDVIVMEKELERIKMTSIDTYDYDLMTLDHLPKEAESCKIQNLKLKKPTLDDVEKLLPLRKGYEEEEVLPKGSVFRQEAGRIVLANFISSGKILSAQLNGKIIGKIVVNAISFTRYQIGGVYVLPEYRGQGIATAMTYNFVNSLINEGRGVTLFVKKSNTPARKLYASLGFKYRADYRISYY